MRTLITDIGYGDTKYAYEQEGELRLRKMPTAVVRLGREKETVEGIGVSRELIYNGIRYAVGRDAIRRGIPLITRKKGFIPTYAPIIVAKIMQEAGEDFDAVVVSVAISDFTREYRELLQRSLSDFTVNKKTYGFKKVLVFPQGYGIYRDVFPEGEKGLVVVADIGFNTIDISIYEDGKPLKEELTGFPGYGSSRMIQNLVEKVKERVGKPVTEIEINQVVQGKERLKIYGREIDITDLVEEEKRIYTEEVFAVIENSPIGKLWEQADVRIIGGGGGYFITEDFRRKYDITVPEQPEFSNVRGFYNAIKESGNE